jgi:hypothetical protein
MRRHRHAFVVFTLVFVMATFFSAAAAHGLQTATGTTGIDAGSTEDTFKTALSSCAATPGLVVIRSAIDLADAVNVPVSCVLSFQPGAEFKGSGAIIVRGEIIAPQSQQIFRAPLAVSGLSAATSASGSIPVEWFGANSTGFKNCATASDATDAIQAALHSLSLAGSVRLGPACYHTTHALTITRSAIGIKGAGQGFADVELLGGSVLLSTSPTADILDLTGTKESYLTWNRLEDFAVERAVAPTGSATGIAVSFAGGLRVSGVESLDSVRNLYLHAVPDYGLGAWRDVSVGWGYTRLHGYSGNLYGWYFDSSDDVAMNSFKGDHLACSNNLGSGPTTFCYYVAGKAVKDIDLDSANVAGATYGLYLNYTGNGEQDSDADIHINMPTMDDCYISCIFIKGLTPEGAASVSVNAGYLESNTPGAKIVDIEDSYGVAITNNQIFAIASRGPNTGVYANNSVSLSIGQNKFQQLSAGTAVQMVHTTGSAITGNTLLGSPKQPMTTGITLENNSNGNAISGNAALGNLGTAYRFDDTSRNNDFVGNACATSNISHCVDGKPKKTAPHD